MRHGLSSEIEMDDKIAINRQYEWDRGPKHPPLQRAALAAEGRRVATSIGFIGQGGNTALGDALQRADEKGQDGGPKAPLVSPRQKSSA